MKQCHYNEAISSHRKSRGRHGMDQQRNEMLMSFKNFEILLLKTSSASLNPVELCDERAVEFTSPRNFLEGDEFHHCHIIRT